MSRSIRLKERAWLFLKLGTIGFGGPAAHIAMMEDEVVRRRGWLSHEKFIDLVDWLTLSLAVLSAALLFRLKLNSAWLVAIGALVGLIQHLAF